MLGALQGLIGWLPLGLPAFLFVITAVIFFHELGHFLVARAFGVKVEAFSIGFGPPIVEWTDGKGTRWKISWIPFGGYVKFYGDLDAASVPDRERIEQLSEDERRSVFLFKPLYQRALVVVAGPLANFVLALVIFAGAFMIVGEVTSLGTEVGAVTAGEPAALSGIKPGDRIETVNGRHVSTFDDLVQAIHRAGAHPVRMSILRSGHLVTAQMTPRRIAIPDLTGGTIHKIGIGLSPSDDMDNSTFVRLGPIDALGAASQRVWFVVDMSMTYLSRVVDGHADADQLSGPVTIAAVSGQVAATGFLNLIGLVAFISISIGMVNLFPIPILDGGHLLYYGCEAILGRPLNARAQDLGFRLGLAVMLGLMVFATWNDLVRLNLF
jgi:regulator of sigma E protease